ncbi:alpha/beta fold hydrolase [Fulvivirga ligni]|uniref:alpha/beta fold hydrolase n=1 Tax=Fulvivirga ligni TaxID=2904246 RepID=UPI001F30124A|nr:alpha/beta hydrolase [Fulvivirga ligni]UII19845.1 alpha/beta hydrolase [Fulvivirga ligni]
MSNSLMLEQLAIEFIQPYPDRPTIIFLHDSLGCIRLWRDFPKKLGEATQCNVLIYDRQGYGQSCPFSYDNRTINYMEDEADLLNNLINYLQLKDVILFGHSDGGSIALIAAGKYPEKIKAIITEGAHILVEDITIAGILEAILLYKDTDLKSKLNKYHGDKTEPLFKAWADTWTSPFFREWNIETFLPHIQCPALIIQGEDDEYGTLDQVYRTTTGIGTKASSLIIPNVKHTPHKEVAELVIERSAGFILKWQ